MAATEENVSRRKVLGMLAVAGAGAFVSCGGSAASASSRPPDREVVGLDRIETGSFAVQETSPEISNTLRVISWNINRGSRFDLIVAFLASMNPDLVLLQESDLNARRSGFRDVARDLAQKLKMNYIFGTEFVELGQTNGTSAALHGQATLSRLLLKNPRILRFTEQSNFWRPRWFLPSIGLLQRRLGGRMALITEVAVNGQPVTTYNLHLESRDSDKLRYRQLCEVLDDAQRCGSNPKIILGGDFNFDVTQGPAKEAIEARNFQNLFVKVRSHGVTQSLGSPQHRKIDWILVRGALAPGNPHIHASTPGSDHVPLSMTVRLW